MTFELSRLGVNIDHLATLRQLRGSPYPNLLEASRVIQRAGGHQLTIHLREDRRHIQDTDVRDLIRAEILPVNFELSLAPEILKIALKVKPSWACLVPERRQEVTTEGGLDVARLEKRIGRAIEGLQSKGIRVSLFIEPSVKVVQLARKLGADAFEIHTGKYSTLYQKKGPKAALREFKRIEEASREGVAQGLRVHAGHGLDLENVRPLAALERESRQPLIEEFNIGHFLVCYAAIHGMERAVREMLASLHAP